MDGAQAICRSLQALGVRHVFGLPGTQNVRLYDALRSTGLRAVVPADEGAAAFMACGYARASGAPAVLTTIPGPGFMYALAGVAEALHDSVPLLWLTLRQEDTGRAFQLQRIDQPAIARAVVKQCVYVDRRDELVPALQRAWNLATDGEPGPVLVEVAARLLAEQGTDADVAPAPVPAGVDVAALAAAMAGSRRPLLFVGQGAQGAAGAVRALAHRLGCPVVFTSSGRGVLPDTDALAFVQDFSTGLGPVLPDLLARADLVLALGCKFTHNGSAGGTLVLPAERLARIDSSAAVLQANYPARLTVQARVEDALAALENVPMRAADWDADDIRVLRARLADSASQPIDHEPRVAGTTTGAVRDLFVALAAALGERGVYVTDAGLHQALTRRYAVVARPRGLLCPSDFQSMGFGLPAAIGAAFADPSAIVLACIGDAGLALSAGDLQTAVREGVDLAVVVFNDGQMNLIRRQQVTSFGYASGVAVDTPDLAKLAAAIGCSYVPVQGDVAAVAAAIAGGRGVRIVELRLGDVASLDWQQVRGAVREGIRQRVPDGPWQALRRLLRR